MQEVTQTDTVILVTIAGVFVVGLWSTVFAFLYGFQKRLDTIILLLQGDRSGGK
ncbi:MAG: hypothetical protein O3B73_18685 [bacterium]|jgi:hypothetical protein|nr:hypothetical protein [bacterium]